MRFSKLFRYYSIKTTHGSFSNYTTEGGVFGKAKAARMARKETRPLKVQSRPLKNRSTRANKIPLSVEAVAEIVPGLCGILLLIRYIRIRKFS